MLIAALLLLALIAANLPFFNERLFAVIALKSAEKHIGWRIVEILVLYFLMGAVAYVLEHQQGPVHNQNWQFYIATFCLFIVFAFPGFVIRYFWRKPGA